MDFHLTKIIVKFYPRNFVTMIYENDDEIYFYGHVIGKYPFMSNFYPIDFIDLKTQTPYTCSEQYLMHRKALMFDPDNHTLIRAILRETRPATIKAFGRQVKNYDERQWNDSRYNIMVEGLYLKFSQNESIREMLIATAPKTLYEAAPQDKIWGIGFSVHDIANAYDQHYNKKKTGENHIADLPLKSAFGRNLLGIALMSVRGRLMRLG